MDFLLLPKIWVEVVVEGSGKNIIKTLSSEYSQELLDHGKQSVTDSLKATSQKAIQKTAEATTDSIRTEIVDRITKVSKHFQQNN